MDKPFVITIVGAESSGKTTLAMKLAEYFACPWVPEYAREYLEGLGRPYKEDDLGIIAARQWDEINKQLSISKEQYAIGKMQSAISNRQREDDKNWQFAIGNKQFDPSSNSNVLIKGIKSLLVTRYSSFVFVDGGMMNLRMWARIKYKLTIPLVEKALENDVTDLYLLCRPLNEWEPDPLREAPSIIDRIWIYNQYLEELSKSKKNLEILSDNENEKFNEAVLLIEKLLQV